MLDLKVGDKVRIRTWKGLEDDFGSMGSGSINCKYGFTKSMKVLCGTEHEVLRLGDDMIQKIDGFTIGFDMLEKIENEVEPTVPSKEEMLKTLLEKMVVLEQELVDKAIAHRDISNTLDSTKDEVESLSRTIDDLEYTVNDLEGKVSDAQSELDDAKSEFEDAESNIEACESDLERLQEEAEELNEKFAALKNEIEKLTVEPVQQKTEAEIEKENAIERAKSLLIDLVNQAAAVETQLARLLGE